MQVRKRVFLRHFILKMIILPRQARGKHRENSEGGAFFIGGTAARPSPATQAWGGDSVPQLQQPPQSSSAARRHRPQSAGATTQSTGAPQWRPPRPHSAAPASRSIAARSSGGSEAALAGGGATRRRPQSADSYSARIGVIRPSVSMLAV